MRMWPLTAIEIKRVLQGNYQLGTIYAALRRLRLAGVTVPRELLEQPTRPETNEKKETAA